MQIAELKNLIVNLCLEERRSYLPKPQTMKRQSTVAVYPQSKKQGTKITIKTKQQTINQ